MTLDSISITNYKNIADAQLEFSPNVNCLVGNNGMGKTNVLDAIYYLSFCRSYMNQPDASVIKYGEQYCMLQGHYTRRDKPEDISIGLQRGKRKAVRRGGKEYQRLSQHIGLLPIVMAAPIDWELISGGGEHRRSFINRIISQTNREYLEALIRYNKALQQRNTMLRQEAFRDPLLYETVEAQLCEAASLLHATRKQWVEAFVPVFMRYYTSIAGTGEKVSLSYVSQLNKATMRQLLDQNRERDLALGYTSRGVHRDDIELLLDGHSMRQAGSQGQCKTYTVALRLAQFHLLRASTGITPLLLLDDIFDKLDASRVASIIKVVSEEKFGQIFITDTNRSHLDDIIASLSGDYRLWEVAGGECKPITTHNATQQ